MSSTSVLSPTEFGSRLEKYLFERSEEWRAVRVELIAAEEIGVAADDLGLLGDLLLPHPHRTRLLGPLEQVAAQTVLELGRVADGQDAHGRAR